MISFAKYHCAGNDFVILPQGVSISPSEVVQVCHRRFGIGADGVLSWKRDGDTFRFKIQNSDGSEAEMCGNGLRCVAHFIAEKYSSPLTIHSQTRIHQCIVSGNEVDVELGVPEWKAESLILDEGYPAIDIIDTGVPHAVFEGEGFDSFAEKIRNHPSLLPSGANVTVIEPECIRTFERGVEEETFSCGTGAAAALCYLQKKNGIKEYTANFRRGTKLFQKICGGVVMQSATVCKVFEGSLALS